MVGAVTVGKLRDSSAGNVNRVDLRLTEVVLSVLKPQSTEDEFGAIRYPLNVGVIVVTGGDLFRCPSFSRYNEEVLPPFIDIADAILSIPKAFDDFW